MFLLDKNIFLTKEMHHVKSKLLVNISHAPSTQFISLVTLAWFEIKASRMGFCQYSDKCVDT
jgi:hypothetical protein